MFKTPIDSPSPWIVLLESSTDNQRSKFNYETKMEHSIRDYIEVKEGQIIFFKYSLIIVMLHDELLYVQVVLNKVYIFQDIIHFTLKLL